LFAKQSLNSIDNLPTSTIGCGDLMLEADFREDAPWLGEPMVEPLGFRGVRHDDQVDSISQALAFISWRESHRSSSEELRIGRTSADRATPPLEVKMRTVLISRRPP